MVTRPLGEPCADSGVFMSSAVVDDQVDIELGGDPRVDVAQKAQNSWCRWRGLDGLQLHFSRRHRRAAGITKTALCHYGGYG